VGRLQPCGEVHLCRWPALGDTSQVDRLRRLDVLHRCARCDGRQPEVPLRSARVHVVEQCRGTSGLDSDHRHQPVGVLVHHDRLGPVGVAESQVRTVPRLAELGQQVGAGASPLAEDGVDLGHREVDRPPVHHRHSGLAVVVGEQVVDALPRPDAGGVDRPQPKGLPRGLLCSALALARQPDQGDEQVERGVAAGPRRELHGRRDDGHHSGQGDPEHRPRADQPGVGEVTDMAQGAGQLPEPLWVHTGGARRRLRLRYRTRVALPPAQPRPDAGTGAHHTVFFGVAVGLGGGLQGGDHHRLVQPGASDVGPELQRAGEDGVVAPAGGRLRDLVGLVAHRRVQVCRLPLVGRRAVPRLARVPGPLTGATGCLARLRVNILCTLLGHPLGQHLRPAVVVLPKEGQLVQLVGDDRVAAPVVLGPQRAGQEHVAPERLDVDTGEARQHLVVRRRVRADQVRVPGDVEVLTAAGGVDLGEDPHPQLVQQCAHLLDVGTVFRVNVDHRAREWRRVSRRMPTWPKFKQPVANGGPRGQPSPPPRRCTRLQARRAHRCCRQSASTRPDPRDLTPSPPGHGHWHGRITRC
jgi:hypothetical protein